MDEQTATEQTAPETAPAAPPIAPEEDLESKVALLEAEAQKLLEEKENYRKAYLKEATRAGSYFDESDEERLRKIAREELHNSKLAQITKEKEDLLARALKENKELKLAQLNKTSTPPAAMGSHNESAPVRDTILTPEQEKFLRTNKGFTDADVERYKKNLLKRV